MANRVWTPRSRYRQQKVNVVAGGTITTETFTITAGGIIMASFVAASSTADQVRDGLIASWNDTAGTTWGHAYKAAITSSGVSPVANGTGTILFIANIAGTPFALTLNTPGGAATFTQSTIQTNLSPNNADLADNWGGTAPTTGDDILIPAGTPKLLWGLDLLTATHGKIEIEDGAPLIGLPQETFATGEHTFDSSYKEYRATYLALKGTDHFIGRSRGGNLAAISRCKLDTGNVASNITAIRSGHTVGNHPPIQIKCNHASTNIYNRGVAMEIAMDQLGDTSTCGSIFHDSTSARTLIGKAVTYATGDFSMGVAHAYSNPTSLLVARPGADVNLYSAGTIPTIRGGGAPKTHGARVTFTTVE